MATTILPALKRLINNIKIQCIGATEDPIKIEMFNTFDEFCRETKCWKDSVPLTTISGTQTYEVAPTDDGQAHLLVNVTDTLSGALVSATMPTPGFVKLAFIPNTVRALTVKLALAPVDPADVNGWPVMPDWIVQKYFLGLTAGVLSKLMVHPAKPYSNQTMAVLNLRKFSSTKTGARADALHENTLSAQNWTFPAGWGGSIRQRNR